jgi:hypothetical protein
MPPNHMPMGCTAVIEQIRDITTCVGTIETFIVHPDRNGPQAAERHWERLIALYRRRLG